MSDSPPLDVLHLVAVARGRLCRRRRMEGLLEGLTLGALGAALAAVWQAAVDPTFPWQRVAPLIAAAGFLPYGIHLLRLRVSAEQAAWYLDRRVRAGGRLPALVEDGGRFRQALEGEVRALRLEGAGGGYGRVRRRLLRLGCALVGLVLVRLLAPVAEVPESGANRALASGAVRTDVQALAAVRLAARLAERGEGRLADGLAELAPRIRRGAHEDASMVGLARSVEDRLQQETHRAALRRALGDSPVGRALAARLAGTGGEGTAVTRPLPEAEALLARAAADPRLSAALQRQLSRAAAAARDNDSEAFAAAASAVREALGAALPPRLLAEAAELLAALEDDSLQASADRSGTGGKSGHSGDRAVRGLRAAELVLDPDLRRVIRRYFQRDQGRPVQARSLRTQKKK